jgi:predicted ATPase
LTLVILSVAVIVEIGKPETSSVRKFPGLCYFVENSANWRINTLALLDQFDELRSLRLDRLAPTREVAQIGAALGRSFSHELISAVASMPRQQLDDALVQLVNAELVFQRGKPPDAEYTFKHALVQDAAYRTLLRSRRQQLRARIATVVEGQFPEIVTTQPEWLAHHFDAAGLTAPAVDYYHRAANRAMAASVNAEAIVHLKRGLELIASLPASAERSSREFDFRFSLGPPLIATQGWGSAEAEANLRELRF